MVTCHLCSALCGDQFSPWCRKCFLRTQDIHTWISSPDVVCLILELMGDPHMEGLNPWRQSEIFGYARPLATRCVYPITRRYGYGHKKYISRRYGYGHNKYARTILHKGFF